MVLRVLGSRLVMVCSESCAEYHNPPSFVIYVDNKQASHVTSKWRWHDMRKGAGLGKRHQRCGASRCPTQS